MKKSKKTPITNLSLARLSAVIAALLSWHSVGMAAEQPSALETIPTVNADAPDADAALVVDALTDKVIQGFQSDRDKAEAISKWIASNIDYDVDKFLHRDKIWPQNAQDVLKARKGVCGDYVVLFAAMAKRAGLQTKTVMGYAVGAGDADTKENHAWNKVLIDGQWLIVDTTWAAGVVTKDMQFARRFNPRMILAKPQDILISHFETKGDGVPEHRITLDQFRHIDVNTYFLANSGVDQSQLMDAVAQGKESSLPRFHDTGDSTLDLSGMPLSVPSDGAYHARIKAESFAGVTLYLDNQPTEFAPVNGVFDISATTLKGQSVAIGYKTHTNQYMLIVDYPKQDTEPTSIGLTNTEASPAQVQKAEALKAEAKRVD